MARLDDPDEARVIEDLYAEVMEKAAASAAHGLEGRRRKRLKAWHALVLLLPVLIGLTIWNVARITRSPEPFTHSEMLNGARVTVILTAQALENHRDAMGAYPANLEMIGMDEDGLAYTLSGDSYSLRMVFSGDTVAYRPGDDITPFAEAAAPLFQEIER